MSFVIRTHDGRELAIKQTDPTKLAQLAKQLELTAVELLSGEIVYLSKGTVARMENNTQIRPKTIDPDFRIEAPDNRGKHSPALENMREAIKRKDFSALKKQTASDKNNSNE